MSAGGGTGERRAVAPGVERRAALASVGELRSTAFREVMERANALARELGLRTFTNWSKVWEYPWLWLNALRHVDWRGATLVDLGSELSPMPWLIGALGARVVLVETDERYVRAWERVRRATGAQVSWRITSDERIPVEDGAADVVTSFSVVEHQPDKRAAADQIARVLRPGGLLAMSFDLCEPEMGMAFPAWNGRALTMREFEATFWSHPAFGGAGGVAPPRWNVEDIPEYLAWHRESAPHHTYVTGAAVLRREG